MSRQKRPAPSPERYPDVPPPDYASNAGSLGPNKRLDLKQDDDAKVEGSDLKAGEDLHLGPGEDCGICHKLLVHPVTFKCNFTVCWFCYLTTTHCPACQLRHEQNAGPKKTSASFIKHLNNFCVQQHSTNVTLDQSLESKYPVDYQTRVKDMVASSEIVPQFHYMLPTSTYCVGIAGKIFLVDHVIVDIRDRFLVVKDTKKNTEFVHFFPFPIGTFAIIGSHVCISNFKRTRVQIVRVNVRSSVESDGAFAEVITDLQLQGLVDHPIQKTDSYFYLPTGQSSMAAINAKTGAYRFIRYPDHCGDNSSIYSHGDTLYLLEHKCLVSWSLVH